MGTGGDKQKTPERIPAPHENTTPLDYREQFQGRHAVSQFIDPCAAASKASMDCLARSGYSKADCKEYFDAYKACKLAWLEQRREDRRAGRPTK